MSMCFKKVGFLASTIVSTAISTVSLFAAFELNHQAKAIVVSGDPNDYIVEPGTGYDGVVRLLQREGSERGGCTAALLSSGKHILTAAHCLDNRLAPGLISSANVLFDLPFGTTSIKAKNFFVHPDWDGFDNFDSLDGDLAILELTSMAPEAAERYDIYRNTDEIGQVNTKVGYGLSGQGNQGLDRENFPYGVKRLGQNLYDSVGEILSTVVPANFIPGAFLAYDFDNGKPENDAFGTLGLPDLGLGLQEVTPASGDSGSPIFINGLIAGITSGGTCVGFDFVNFNCSSPPDVDNVVNASFGEFGFDTRVSTYASYIDDVLAGNIAPTKTIPEPNTIFSAILALGAFAVHSRSKKAQ
ncbi:trypsin-like serine protease [Capilliphycus salinus ALCB114379]|uniref:trypsin-like serine protease n=1 Tax=Capilliphycus salinus TaxID=2768948 RepID=UPI0039A51976